MAPRLIARSLESPRQVELAGAGPQGSMSETASDLERTPNPLDPSGSEFLSLFKGQGAAVRGDDRVVERQARQPPAAGV